MRPQRRQPPGFPIHWILQARTLEWVAIFLLQCMKVKSESKVAQSCPTSSDSMDCSLPGSSLSMGFSRQEYWSGLPLPSLNSPTIGKKRKRISQSCLTLLQPQELYPTRLLCPLGSLSVGILQARLLEWIAMPSSRGSFQPRDQTQVTCIAGIFFTD